MKIKLTERETELLKAIKAYYKEHRMPPTAAELGQTMGISRQRVAQLLQAIEGKGAIERDPAKYRSIQIVR